MSNDTLSDEALFGPDFKPTVAPAKPKPETETKPAPPTRYAWENQPMEKRTAAVNSGLRAAARSS